MTTAILSANQTARIPLFVNRAQISGTAKSVWIELAFCATPKRPQVYVDIVDLAGILRRKGATISSAVRELAKANLLKWNGQWVQKRYKIYTLSYALQDVANVPDQEPCETASRTEKPVEVKEEKINKTTEPTNSEAEKTESIENDRQKYLDREKYPHYILNENDIKPFLLVAERMMDRGLTKDEVMELVAKYGYKECDKAMHELIIIEELGDRVGNRAAWLEISLKAFEPG